MEPTFHSGDIVIASFIEPRYWEQAIKSNQLFVIVTQQDVLLKRVVNHLRHDKKIECHSDNAEYQVFQIEAENIREVWRARMKITSHLEAPVSIDPTRNISEQLETQKLMLENLQKQLSLVTAG
jgi:hypothetical protein